MIKLQVFGQYPKLLSIFRQLAKESKIKLPKLEVLVFILYWFF